MIECLVLLAGMCMDDVPTMYGYYEFKIDGVRYVFMPDIGWCGKKNNCVGYYKKSKPNVIYLKSGERADVTFNATRHELYHKTHTGNMENHHKIIGDCVEKLPDWVQYPEAMIVVERAVMR